MTSPENEASQNSMTSVVIVVFNGRDHIESCLKSVVSARNSCASEITVVDNNSTDGSCELIEDIARGAANVRLLRSGGNRGYAGAVNMALGQAGGRYIAVLNQDITVSDGWLDALVKFLDQSPGVGAVNPLIVTRGSSDVINSTGQDIHVTGLGFNRNLGGKRSSLIPGPFRVDGLHGAAFVIRKDILEKTGGWDETGFLYHEDVELSWLLLTMGYGIYCVPEAVVEHDYHLTMYPEKLFLLERNRWKMLLTYLRPRTLLAISPLIACTEFLLWSYCILRGPGFLRAKFMAYRSVAALRPTIRLRQSQIRQLRRVSDFQVLRHISWRYRWKQFFTLGSEKGESRRKPSRGFQVDIWK
ncbi:MAG: glycosyltransferase family 2 protein [Verrucomicrobia bacterium]|nr:glycosyltransferase family 2 protein [Verrucomicrobiota bacterium]